MMSKTFLSDLGERAAKTFVQVFVATLLASGPLSIESVTDLSLLQRCAVAGVGAVLSILTSLASSKVGDPGTASAVPAPAGE